MSVFPILKNCTGVNNVVDPKRLPHDYKGQTSDLQYGVDVVVTEGMRLSRADGFASVASLTNGHSLYRKSGDCVVCQGGSLYAVGSDYSLTGLRSGMTGGRVSYDQHGAAIYYSNGSESGIIHSNKSWVWRVEDYLGVDSDNQWLPYVPGFSHIAFHAGHLVGSVGNVLYCSELGKFGLFNKENVRVFSSDIIMIESVKGGIFVSDCNDTWFLAGTCNYDFIEGSAPVLDYPAFEWSAAYKKVEGLKIGLDTIGLCAVWNSPKGLCAGLPTGEAVNLIDDKVIYPQGGSSGATLVRGYSVISTTDSAFTTDTQLRVGSVGSKATTQRTNFNFNSYCEFNGRYLACGSGGLYSIGGGTHNGAAITGVFEPMTSVLGSNNPKRTRFLYFDMEGSGDVVITPYADDVQGTAKTMTLGKSGQQAGKVAINRDSQGVSWRFNISNDSDFSIDSITALTTKRPMGANNY